MSRTPDIYYKIQPPPRHTHSSPNHPTLPTPHLVTMSPRIHHIPALLATTLPYPHRSPCNCTSCPHSRHLSPTHPPLQHFPLQPWPPSALPRHHTHHTPSRHVSPFPPRRLSHCCSQALATPIIAKPRARPQGCQRRSSSLRRSFPSLLGPLAPKPTHSSSSRGP